jgi:hypothetical protein
MPHRILIKFLSVTGPDPIQKLSEFSDQPVVKLQGMPCVFLKCLCSVLASLLSIFQLCCWSDSFTFRGDVGKINVLC